MERKTSAPREPKSTSGTKEKEIGKGSYNAELSSHPVSKKSQLPEDGSFSIINDEESVVPINGDVEDVDLKADTATTPLGGDDDEIVMGTEADVTEEDLKILGKRDEDMDLNDDELTEKEGLDDTDIDGDPLNEGKTDTDSPGDDLDIPGAEEDDAEEALGEEDEENNYYSLDDEDDDEKEKS
jgi:hypothetical protein